MKVMLNKTKQHDQEKKTFQRRKSNPRPLTCKGNAMSIEPRQVVLIIVVKLIIVQSFCPWNSAGWRDLKLVELIFEELKDIFEENKQGFDGKGRLLTNFVAFEEQGDKCLAKPSRSLLLRSLYRAILSFRGT